MEIFNALQEARDAGEGVGMGSGSGRSGSSEGEQEGEEQQGDYCHACEKEKEVEEEEELFDLEEEAAGCCSLISHHGPTGEEGDLVAFESGDHKVHLNVSARLHQDATGRQREGRDLLVSGPIGKHPLMDHHCWASIDQISISQG